MFDNRTIVALALAGATLAATPAANAKTNFDGAWSVVIVTDKGQCDRAYRYPVRISEGAVGYGGDATGFKVSGRVAATGALTVTVSRGSQSATGTGKLAAAGGGGSWTGGDCSGTWTAEKRS